MIHSYIVESAREYGVDRAIRFHHRVVRAEWSSPDARWTVEVERTDTGERLRMTCGFLHVCSASTSTTVTCELTASRFDSDTVNILNPHRSAQASLRHAIHNVAYGTGKAQMGANDPAGRCFSAWRAVAKA